MKRGLSVLAAAAILGAVGGLSGSMIWGALFGGCAGMIIVFSGELAGGEKIEG